MKRKQSNMLSAYEDQLSQLCPHVHDSSSDIHFSFTKSHLKLLRGTSLVECSNRDDDIDESDKDCKRENEKDFMHTIEQFLVLWNMEHIKKQRLFLTQTNHVQSR